MDRPRTLSFLTIVLYSRLPTCQCRSPEQARAGSAKVVPGGLSVLLSSRNSPSASRSPGEHVLAHLTCIRRGNRQLSSERLKAIEHE